MADDGTESGEEFNMCRICGDKANGFNFDVLSCESCKAFFRRNALKKDNLSKCTTNTCTITITSRKKCSDCRLRKCFEVGMNSDRILSEEQRNRRRRRMQTVSSSGESEINNHRLIRDNSDQDNVNTRGKRKADADTNEWKKNTVRTDMATFEETTQHESASAVGTARQNGPSLSTLAHNSTSSSISGNLERSIFPRSPADLAVLESEDAPAGGEEMVTIRIPKSALLRILAGSTGGRVQSSLSYSSQSATQFSSTNFGQLDPGSTLPQSINTDSTDYYSNFETVDVDQ